MAGAGARSYRQCSYLELIVLRAEWPTHTTEYPVGEGAVAASPAAIEDLRVECPPPKCRLPHTILLPPPTPALRTTRQ